MNSNRGGPSQPGSSLMNIKRASLNQQYSESYVTTQGDLVTIIDHVKPEKSGYESNIIRMPLTST